MVKKILSVLIAFTLVFSLSATESAGDSLAYAGTHFSSLEDFLNACLMDLDFGDVKLTELETIYLLTVVPENFVIRYIGVTEYYVKIAYLPEDLEALEWLWSYWRYPYFELSFHRIWDDGVFLESRNMARNIRYREALTSEVKAIDLTDTAAVRMLINHLTQPFTTAEALTVLRAAAGLIELTDEQAERFAIDGEPTTADALRILRIVAGL
jgi:hypothetical protein